MSSEPDGVEKVDVERMIRSYESRLALADAKLSVASMELRRLKADLAECAVLAGLPASSDMYALMTRVSEIKREVVDRG